MRISDWSSDVCSSDLRGERRLAQPHEQARREEFAEQRSLRAIHGGEAPYDDAEDQQPLARDPLGQQAERDAHHGIDKSEGKPLPQRSTERRGGQESHSKCRSTGLPDPKTKNKT